MTRKYFKPRTFQTIFFAVAILSMVGAVAAAQDDGLSDTEISYEEAPAPSSASKGYADVVVLSSVETETETSTDESSEDEKEASEKADGVFTGSLPETADLQRQLDELREEFKAEQKKNKKSDKLTDAYNVKFGGFLGVGSALISQEEGARDFFGDCDNVFDIHDLRFTAKGTGHGNLQFAAGVGFQDSIKLYDNYVRFKDSGIFGDVTIGHFYVESGMESIEPAFEPVFICTDENSSFFRMNRRLGVSSVIRNEDKTARAFFGIFAAPSVQTWSNRSFNDDPGIILNTRLTAAPILCEDADGFTHDVFHVGGSFYWLGCTDDGSRLNLRTRGLNWTGTNPYFISGIISLQDRSYFVTQAETAYQHDGFGLSAEGFASSISDGGGGAYGANVSARWCVTPGCMRSYNRDDARFTTMKMPEEAIFVNNLLRASKGGGYGALEAVAKWDYVETTDVNFTTLPGLTGQVNRMVFGFNWWWNPQTSVAVNWEHAFVDSQIAGRKAKSEFDTCAMQIGVKF